MGTDTASTNVRPAPKPNPSQTARPEGNTGSVLVNLDANFKIGLKGNAVRIDRMIPNMKKLRGPEIFTPAETWMISLIKR